MPPPASGGPRIGEIADVLYAYCEAVDEFRIDALVELFCPDCRFDRGFEMVHVGRAALREFMTASLSRYGASSHHVSNVRVRLDGDSSAQATSYVHAFLRFKGSCETAQLWARYHDRLVERDDRWLIAERAIRAAGWKDLPAAGPLPPFEPMRRGDGVAQV